jgi:putative copper export protein
VPQRNRYTKADLRRRFTHAGIVLVIGLAATGGTSYMIGGDWSGFVKAALGIFAMFGFAVLAMFYGPYGSPHREISSKEEPRP